MMSRYAVIRTSDGLVTNVIEWDGLPGWAPPAGHDARQSNVAGPGDTWDGAKYVKPVPPVAVDERAEYAAATDAEKLALLARKVGMA